MSKPISKLGITGVTVSVQIADTSYGAGATHFTSVSSRLPDNVEGLQMSADEVIQDGIDKYLAAWQVVMQARLAESAISVREYKNETMRVLTRIKQVRALYKKLVQAEAV
jgi:GTP cyclohydrolase FolE2